MSSPVPNTSGVGFKAWKRRLQEDCARQEKLDAFNALGDFVLEMFWKLGLEPTVQAIVKDGDRTSPPGKFFPRREIPRKSA
jgi:hypothetical protein